MGVSACIINTLCVSQAFKVLSQTPGIGIVFLKHSRVFPKPLGLGCDLCLIFFQEKLRRRRRSEEGAAELTSAKFARAICGSTNHRNKGLISVNRRTSLLSHVQYPVPIKVVYKGFNALSARKAIKFGVGPEPIATREHREQIYRRFPAWILT